MKKAPFAVAVLPHVLSVTHLACGFAPLPLCCADTSGRVRHSWPAGDPPARAPRHSSGASALLAGSGPLLAFTPRPACLPRLAPTHHLREDSPKELHSPDQHFPDPGLDHRPQLVPAAAPAPPSAWSCWAPPPPWPSSPPLPQTTARCPSPTWCSCWAAPARARARSARRSSRPSDTPTSQQVSRRSWHFSAI